MGSIAGNGSRDEVIRATTDDGSFRVLVAVLTDTVRGVCDAQKLGGEAARALGELVAGTVLVRETMSPNIRVQGLLRDTLRDTTLVADSHPDGTARGLVRRSDPTVELVFDEWTQLEVMRSLANGALHKGAVEAPPGGGLSGAFMQYLQTSEQVTSMVAIGSSARGDGGVETVAGYIVQLMPDLSEAALAAMTERITQFERIDALLAGIAEPTADALLARLLGGFAHTVTARSPHAYACRCDDVRLLATLATLPRGDIESLAESDEPLEITCDFCGREYRVPVEQLRGLRSSS